MSNPEAIVQLPSGTFAGSFLVSDAVSTSFWRIPAGGGPAVQFDNFNIGSIGEVLLPASFLSSAGEVFVALNNSGDIVNTSTAAVTGAVTGPSNAQWTTAVAVPAGFGAIGGDILIGDETNTQLDLLAPGSSTASVWANMPINPFGVTFAPAGFGSVAGELLITDGSGNSIYAVNSSGASTLFATLPAGTTLRQMSFAPAGFGNVGGDLFISASSPTGEVFILNSAGQLVQTLTAATLGVSNPATFSPRSITFLNSQQLLLADYGQGEVLEITSAVVTPEPAPAIYLCLAALAAFAVRRRASR